MAVIRRKVHTKAKKVVHKVAKKAVKRAPTKVFKKSVKVPAKKVVKKPVKKMAAKKVPAAKTPQPKGVANLLITFDPNHAGLAQTEVVSVCERCGSKPVFLKSDVEGLFKIIVPDAKQLVRKLRAACITAPESFLATFHYAPITKWCKSDIESIKKAVKQARY